MESLTANLMRGHIVRMMGTEGRRPGQEIAPSNDVYDAVVFRSGDIEDLQIFEAPAVMAPPKPSFVDPAIVTAVRELGGGTRGPTQEHYILTDTVFDYRSLLRHHQRQL